MTPLSAVPILEKPALGDAALGPHLCVSGGAPGADLQWGLCSGLAGYSVVHWSFQGHHSQAPSQEIVRLTANQLAQADPFCLRANQTLKRQYPPASRYGQNLLRRNYYQIAWSGSLYAVASLVDGQVQGGTGWAVQMFLDRHDNAACAAYVFCQHAGYWFAWQGDWRRIAMPPRPEGVFAGIGSRTLDASGKQAIRTLLDVDPRPDASNPLNRPVS